LRLGLQPLERFASMEVAIEADERAVAQLPRVEVVVFDMLSHEVAADRAGGLLAVGAEPLAISLELLARVDPRKGRGNPARFQGVRGVGTARAGDHAELPAGLENGGADLLLLGIGTLDLESGRS